MTAIVPAAINTDFSQNFSRINQGLMLIDVYFINFHNHLGRTVHLKLGTKIFTVCVYGVDTYKKFLGDLL